MMNELTGRPPDKDRAELNLDTGWALGEDTFRFLVEDLIRLAALTIVEFGSGVSTIRLALALPHTRILSIESDPVFRDRILSLGSQFLADGHSLTVELRELAWQRYTNGFFLSYRADPFPDEIDAVIIDGPPAWTRRGREACLYAVVSRLRMGGLIYLDDYRRRGEKRIVSNWLASYPGAFEVSVQEVGKTVCVLKKIGEASAPRFALPAFIDNVAQNIAYGLGRIFRGSKRTATAALISLPV